jgi:predicted PurR-regulated permease PerM
MGKEKKPAPTDRPTTGKSRIAVLLVLALAATALLFAVVRDFAVALVMAAVLAEVAHPFYAWLTRLLGARPRVAAALTVLLTVAVVVIPFLLFLSALLGQALDIGSEVEVWVSEQLKDPDALKRSVEESQALKRLIPYQEKLIEKAGQVTAAAASFLTQAVAGLIGGAARTGLMLFITLYAMYFFLKDRGGITDWLFGCLPLSTGDRERLVGTFSSVARATLKGTLLIGIVQGALAGVAFAVAGIEGALFWGTVMAVLSAIPGIGSALVWVPAVVYLALSGRYVAAGGLTAWCALVVGTADNVLRPVLVGRGAGMPDLMILVTTIGGLAVFGAAGIVLGPLVGALFMALWTLWGAAVKGEAEPVEE